MSKPLSWSDFLADPMQPPVASPSIDDAPLMRWLSSSRDSRRAPASAVSPAEAAPPVPPIPTLEARLAEARLQGAEQARADMQPEIQRLETALADQIAHFEAERAALQAHSIRLVEAMEALFAKSLAQLTYSACTAILQTKPPLDEHQLEPLMREAISGLQPQKAETLESRNAASPTPIGLLRAAPENMAHILPLLPPHWQLVPDPDLPVGQIEAELGPALQQASFHNRLAQIFPEIQP